MASAIDSEPIRARGIIVKYLNEEKKHTKKNNNNNNKKTSTELDNVESPPHWQVYPGLLNILNKINSTYIWQLLTLKCKLKRNISSTRVLSV